MIKYVAIIQATDRAAMAMYHTGPTHRNYMSPICEDADSAKEWLEENIKKYPEHSHFASSAIIAFDTEQSENAEYMLECLMHVF